jgi:streptogramin lyase
MYFTTYLVEPKNYIGRVTRHGGLTKLEVPTPGAASFGITAGPDGNVWFTENFNGLVGRVNLGACHRREHGHD